MKAICLLLFQLGLLLTVSYPVRHPVKVLKVLSYPVRHPLKTMY